MISHNGKSRAVTVGTDHAYEADDWRARAACVGHDPEIWFPVGGGPQGPPADFGPARAICARCPVRDECLTDAVANNDRWGVRAGLTPDQLDELMNYRACKDCDEPAAEGDDRCEDCQRSLWRKYKRTGVAS